MVERDVPAFNIAVRGLCYFHVTVRTGNRDLHSGIYGGASLNAMHAIVQTLSGVMPRDGRVPEPLRAGHRAAVTGGARGLEAACRRARRRSPRRAPARRTPRRRRSSTCAPGPSRRSTCTASTGGSPTLQKTVIPVEAVANVSIRLAAGQDPAVIAPTFERLLREAAPDGAEVEVELWSSAPPGLVPADARAIELGLEAFEEVLGVRPLLVRTGGAIPLVSELAARGVPTILSGLRAQRVEHPLAERAHPRGLSAARDRDRRAPSTVDSPTLA